MPSQFEKPITVVSEHIDELNHVNNRVYLDWFLDAAADHSTKLGWPIEEYFKRGAGWVVRKHEIEYLAPALLNEELMIRTWVSNMGAGSSERSYEIFRPRDKKTLTTGKTIWVWIDFKTGRPSRIPADVISVFYPQ